MSRYPWEEFVSRYMDSMIGIWSEATWKAMNRRLRRMGLDIRKHLSDGKISTSSPRSMTLDDVRFHLVYRRSLGYTCKEYSHEVSAMKDFFDYCENPAVRSCLRKYPGLRPSGKNVRYPPLDRSDLEKVLCSFEQNVFDHMDFRLIRSYAMLAVFIGCGTRNKELRLADLRDLHVDSWILDIVHVKGEDTYGSSRSVPIPPRFRALISCYIEALPDHAPKGSVALFPPLSGDSHHLSSNSVRKILSIALDDIGISTDPRTLRRTFGQMYLDSGIDSIESVSVLMGHSSTATTEHYYARRRNEAAIETARCVWSSEDSNPSNRKAAGINSQNSKNRAEECGGGDSNP